MSLVRGEQIEKINKMLPKCNKSKTSCNEQAYRVQENVTRSLYDEVAVTP